MRELVVGEGLLEDGEGADAQDRVVLRLLEEVNNLREFLAG